MANKTVKLYWQEDGKTVHTESLGVFSNLTRIRYNRKRPDKFDLLGCDAIDLNSGKLRYWIYTDLHDLLNG